MPGITALTVLWVIFAAGELAAKKTKAIFSTVLGVSILLLIGFWTKLLPATIFTDAGVDKFGNIIAGILITSLGTTIDFAELKRQWKVVVVSLLGVGGAVGAILLGGMLFQMDKMALAGAPIFAGGSAATLIMTNALNELSMEEVSTFCIVLYVMQKFIGVPIASVCLRREAKAFRADPANINAYVYKNTQQGGTADGNKRKLLQLPETYSRPSVYMAKLALVTMLGYYVSRFTNGIIHYFVMCLIMGIIFFGLGFLEKGILQKTQSSGLVTFLVTIIIFSNLATTTPAQVLGVIVPLVTLCACGVAGIAAASVVSHFVLKMSIGFAVALGISCTFGFPTTMLMPQEVAQAIGETDAEKAAIENYLLPKMLTAGLVTVTIVSVLIAGIAVNFL